MKAFFPLDMFFLKEKQRRWIPIVNDLCLNDQNVLRWKLLRNHESMKEVKSSQPQLEISLDEKKWMQHLFSFISEIVQEFSRSKGDFPSLTSFEYHQANSYSSVLTNHTNLSNDFFEWPTPAIALSIVTLVPREIHDEKIANELFYQ